MIPTRTTDFRLAQVEATLRLEDLALDERTRALLRRVMAGEIRHAQAREELLARHRPVVRGS
jgi:hypothetical protein